jgi:hypothetical protein
MTCQVIDEQHTSIPGREAYDADAHLEPAYHEGTKTTKCTKYLSCVMRPSRAAAALRRLATGLFTVNYSASSAVEI